MTKSKSIKNVRVVGMIEGVSFLLLLGVAMPLKYIAGRPEAVRYVGWAHGVLFVLYGLAALQAMRLCGWSFGRLFKLFVASLIPFGPFLVDGELKREEMQEARHET